MRQDRIVVAKYKQLRYLDSSFRQNRMIDQDVIKKLKLDGQIKNCYQSVTWMPIHKMSAANMWMLRWMCGHTRLDKTKK